MPRGGKRSGTPGKGYSNRTDLAQVPKGLPYGERQAREQALQAQPLPRQGGAPPAPPRRPGALAEAVPLDAPTQRPGEPVTAGVPMGPGAGPEALGTVSQAPIDLLRVLYRRFPLESIRQLLERAEEDEADGTIPRVIPSRRA